MFKPAFATFALALALLLAPGAPARATPPGVLSITFDDANLTQLHLGLPDAEKHGIRGTIYVPTLLTLMSSTDTDYTWLMTWRQLAAFRKAGWEIGSHSRTHYDLTTIAPSNLEWEMAGSRNDIKTHLGVTPTTIAAPYGGTNQAVMQAAKKVYDGLVTTAGGVNHPGNLDPYAITRVVVGNDDTTAGVCDQITAAAQDGDWLVLTFHGIVEDKPEKYYVSKAVYDGILACAAAARKAGSLQILTVAEALQELRPPN